MSEENNNFTDSDPCPDEQELKSYASGEMASTRSGRIIGSHLEFCPSCRSRVEKIRKTEVAVDEAIKVFAEKLKRQQEKLVVERWRGPQPGAIWRTVPESDEELLGPMVIVIKVTSPDHSPWRRYPKTLRRQSTRTWYWNRKHRACAFVSWCALEMFLKPPL